MLIFFGLFKLGLCGREDISTSPYFFKNALSTSDNNLVKLSYLQAVQEVPPALVILGDLLPQPDLCDPVIKSNQNYQICV